RPGLPAPQPVRSHYRQECTRCRDPKTHFLEIPQMTLSLKEAQTVVELARAHAKKIGVPMNIAVVNGGGHLLAFARMDRSILGSIDIALKESEDLGPLQRSERESVGILQAGRARSHD